jgi:hypothetical protein
MPTRRNEGGDVAQTSQSTALAIPDDVRADLLRAQQGMVGDRLKLVQAKVMAAGAGRFEFTDTHEIVPEFSGVILGSHQRNVLWDRPADVQPTSDEEKGPACRSQNGLIGIPRAGFAHAALQPRNAQPGDTLVRATGVEQISCASCPYNKWNSKNLIPAMVRPGGSTKGKAVTNQRAVYVLVPGRETPVMVIVAPTSIPAYDEYIGNLVNRNTPVQAMFTTFKQEIKSRGAQRWAVLTFHAGESLGNDAFQKVLAVRARFIETINGTVETLEDEPDEQGARGAAMPATATAAPNSGEDDEDLPF